MDHKISIKVFLEDTDAQGIVYHANYLKFFERARSEWLWSKGMHPVPVDGQGVYFVVHEINIKYTRPGRLGDELEVVSTVKRLSDYRVQFEQNVNRKDGQHLVKAEVTLVCLDPAGELTVLPEDLLQA